MSSPIYVGLAAIALIAPEAIASEEGSKVGQKDLDLSSPKDAFASFRDAHGSQKWEQVFVCLSPESRKLMLFGMMAWDPDDEKASKSFRRSSRDTGLTGSG